MNIIKRFFLYKLLNSFVKKNTSEIMPLIGVLNDHISLKIIIDGWFERRELDALKHFFLKNNYPTKLCLDVGANIGNHSLFFSTIFDQVVSFEPLLKTYKILEINSLLVDNIKTFNFGISDEDKQMPAAVSEGNLGATKLVDSSEDFDETLNLKKLDSFLEEKKIHEVSYIKYDIEGHEIFALRGSEQVIKNSSPIISLELEMTKHYENCLEAIDYLKVCGYKSAYILKNSFSGGLPSNFKKLSIDDFLKMKKRRHKMVLFSK